MVAIKRLATVDADFKAKMDALLAFERLRTNVERSDPQKVLDGDLDEFMAASLAARVGEGKDKEAA